MSQLVCTKGLSCAQPQEPISKWDRLYAIIIVVSEYSWS